MFTASD